MIELSVKVNLGGLGFQSLTNILITVKQLTLLIMSPLAENPSILFSRKIYIWEAEAEVCKLLSGLRFQVHDLDMFVCLPVCHYNY